jgi:hypothetical protein
MYYTILTDLQDEAFIDSAVAYGIALDTFLGKKLGLWLYTAENITLTISLHSFHFILTLTPMQPTLTLLS